MPHLSGEEILAIHSEIIDAVGGVHGVRDIGLFLHIIEKPDQSFDGKETYPTIFLKAAVYFESFARHQAFVDGNKRTAVASAARLLFMEGYALIAKNKELERFTLEIAAKKHEIPAIASWLKARTEKIK